MLDEIIEMIKEMNHTAEINNNTELIKSHIIDSIAIVTLVSDLMDRFDVEILVRDIVPENFATPETIYELIKSKQEEEEE